MYVMVEGLRGFSVYIKKGKSAKQLPDSNFFKVSNTSKFIKGDDNYNIIDWGKAMQKKPLIMVSTAVACVIILASYTNIIGVQTVASSNRTLVENDIDQKELLLQTILDIANNKDIQKLIQKSDIIGGKDRSLSLDANLLLFKSRVLFNVLLPPPPVLTKNYLKYAYNISIQLSRNLDESKIHSIIECYQVSNQWIQKEITNVIEKNDNLNSEITQLSNSNCDCQNNNITRLWNFPVLCTLLIPLFILSFGALIRYHNGYFFEIMLIIGSVLNCFWYRAIIH